MRLESALYSSRAGLQAHGQAIAVIGDNISNSSTVGYRASRVEFTDLLSDGADGHQSTTLPSGGSGATIGRVRQSSETGVVEQTGRSLDVAISGDGFFIAGDPENPSLTRAGNFAIDESGELVTAGGDKVLGFKPGATTLSALNLLEVATTGTQTTTAQIFGNLNSGAAVVDSVPSGPATFGEISESAAFVFPNLTVYDSLGSSHNVEVAFFKTGDNTFIGQAYMDGEEVGGTKGTPVQVGSDVTLKFTDAGKIADSNASAAILQATPAYSGGAATGSFSLDLSKLTQVASSSQVIGISQDGEGTGTISGYKFAGDGTVSAVLSSGTLVNLGTLELGTYPNIDGLDRAGNGLYRATERAGELATGAPGTDGFGKIEQAALERSTVDIANEFIGLVLFQRAYQASSQMLNATSGMIKDTIGLMR